MFALEVIGSLSNSQKSELIKRLDAQNRQRLKLMYKAISYYTKRKTQPNKGVIYKKVFGSPYSKDKDSLYRKEVHHLNNFIKDYLVEQEQKQQASEDLDIYNYHYLNALNRLGLYDYVKKDSKKLIQANHKSIYPFYKTRMHRLLYESEKKHKSFKQNDINAVERQLEEIHESIIKGTLYELKWLQSRLNMNQYKKYIFQNATELFNKTIDPIIINKVELENKKLNDPYINYLDLLSHFFYKTNDEAIPYLKQIAEELKKIDLLNFDSKRELFLTYGNLLSAYSRIGDIETVIKYAKKHFDMGEEHNFIPRPVLISNAVVGYIQFGLFKEAIAIINRYNEALSQLPNYYQILINKSFCYLFLNETKLAISTIQIDLGKLPDFFNMVIRIIYSIAFYLDNQFDLLKNELKNAKALILQRNVANSNLLKRELALFTEYFKWKETDSKDVEKFNLIEENFNNYYNDIGSQKVYVQIIWLQKQLIAEKKSLRY